jgi:DNA polymerase-3 subunit delta'
LGGEACRLRSGEQKAFLTYGIQFFRDAFFLNYPLNQIVHFRSETGFELSKFAPYVHPENVQDLISLFEKAHYHVVRNGSAKMLFADLALKLTRLINLPQKQQT